MPCTRHGETEAQSHSIYPTLSQNCSLPHVFPCLCEVRFSQQRAHSFSWVAKALVKHRGGHEILCATWWAASFGGDCHFQGCCKGLPFFQERCSVPLPPGMLQRAPPPPDLVMLCDAHKLGSHLPVGKNQPVHGKPKQKALGWGLEGKWRERAREKKEGKGKRGAWHSQLPSAAAQ